MIELVHKYANDTNKYLLAQIARESYRDNQIKQHALSSSQSTFFRLR
jgi:hypothetical protein